MRPRPLVLVVLLLVAAASTAAQEPPRAAAPQQRPDGSIHGVLAGEPLSLGTYHALLIGINDYQHTDFAPKLRTAVNDVQTLSRTLTEQYGFKTVKVLLDRQATRAGILRALAEFRDAPLGAGDNFLIYYAGHGHQRPDTEDGFWIPVDATKDEFTWISVADIRRVIRNIKARHTLLVSDSCFSGTLSRAVVNLPTHDRFVREVFLKESYQVMTSGGLEPVADGGRDGLSLFAFSFVNYLRHQTRPYLTAGQLYGDVAPLVANASGSRQTPEHGKIPGTFDQNGQFVFARTGPFALAALPPGSSQAPAAVSPTAANMTRLGVARFLAPEAPWTLKSEKSETPGAEQLPYHLQAKGAQIRVLSAPMGGIEIAKEPKQLREDIVAASLESSRTSFEKQGLRGWKSKRLDDIVVDGVQLSAGEGTVAGLWFYVGVTRNDADGRVYNFVIVAPQRFQADVMGEYKRMLASWKWTER